MARSGYRARQTHSLANLALKLKSIRALSIHLNLEISNASFSFREMSTAIVGVMLHTDKGPVVGYAFNSTGRYSCASAINERFGPRLLSTNNSHLLDSDGLIDPSRIIRACLSGEKPGGDLERSMAIGAIEIASWDALSKYLNCPLHQLLSRRFGNGESLGDVPCYVGGGWYKREESDTSLEREVERYLDLGYEVVKVKVGRDLQDDRQRVERVLRLFSDPTYLAVDANCGLGSDVASYARVFSQFGLRWFEEPVHPLAYRELNRFIANYQMPVATGENCFSIEELKNLVEYGGLRPEMDFLQMDVPQSYGISRYATILEDLIGQGWPRSAFIPHGGNLMSLSIVAGFQLGMCESYPDVFGVFSGFYDQCVIERGCIKVQDLPGVGFESQSSLMDKFKELDLNRV